MNNSAQLTRQELYDILHKALANTEIVNLPKGAFSPSLQLMGPEGLLDSLSCMLFLVDVDKRITEKTGKPMEVVSNFDFTRPGNPFRSVDSLMDFIQDAMKDKS